MSAATDVGRVPRRTLPVLKTILEVAVVVVFVLLIWNNFALRRQQQVRAAAAAKGLRGFTVREQVGVIPATALDGTKRDLDLRNTRAVVAIVNPSCDSCREILTSVRNAPDVRVLSVASLEETRAMAKDLGLGATTSVVAQPLPKALASRLQIYPQLFVLDRGEVVRTCARIEECR
ncbi:MAG TPA: hypothetical protein VGQ36_06275 [Thermoanaerobaculia bacterium]|jgi:hypothetical protein|nr:hypothetical protein [Thermoanaerobaculia bacterium]